MKLFSNLLLTLAVLASAHANAQSGGNYPAKPVRLIIPYQAGGSVDAVGRVFSQRLSAMWGQQVVADNIAGGNTIIGSQTLVRSPADGYTLLMVANTHIVNPWLRSDLPYDTFRDFAPISTLTKSDYLLVARTTLPASSLKELIAYAKANPGKLNSATTGLGSAQHLVNELLMDAAGIQYTIVPYKGGPQVVSDLISGRVDIGMSNLLSFSPHVKAGKMKAIAISGDSRSPVLPDVPTFAEAGLKGYAANNWFALLAPGKTPRDTIQKINAEVGKAQASREVQEMLSKQGIDPFPSSVAETEALFKKDYERFGKVIKEKNIKVED